MANHDRCANCQSRVFARSRIIVSLRCDPSMVLFSGGAVVGIGGLLGVTRWVGIAALLIAVIPAFFQVRFAESCSLCGTARPESDSDPAATPRSA